MRHSIDRPAVPRGLSLADPWLFFAVTFGITWSFWLAAIALGLSFDSALGLVLLLVGLTGPGVAGIAFVYLVYDAEGRRDFWRRATQVRRIGIRWFLLILLLPFAVVLAAAGVDLLTGGQGATWGEGVRAFSTNPLAILPAIFFATLPPLLEELGWRGYALDRLQARWSALAASLILGVVWAVWHLPLFFIAGSYQRDTVGFATPEFWMFMVGVVALSVAFTWVYNHTARSIFGIIVLHGMVNFAGETLEVTRRGEIIFTALWIGFAVLLTLTLGARTLGQAVRAPRPVLRHTGGTG